jgi:hypothetical protein
MLGRAARALALLPSSGTVSSFALDNARLLGSSSAAAAGGRKLNLCNAINEALAIALEENEK